MALGKSIKYVIARFKFKSLPAFDIEYHSIEYLADKLKINVNTLKKIIYNKNYKSKKYDDLIKYVEFIPVY